jgi:dihydroxyacetone kinase-like protein
MKKFLNSVDTMLVESLDGLVAAHADILALGQGHKFVRRKTLKPGKVGLLSGGGAGHEPLHGGFVGEGMLDAACPGQVFTSPTPDQMLEAIAEIDTGGGVLLIVKNYEGDVMNFEMAAEMAEGQIARVLVNDDVAVEDSLYSIGRRGVAGTLVVEKIVGAAAEAGHDLQALKLLGDGVSSVTRSMGVALSACTVPAAGKPMFEIADNEMEFGVGIHGEPGRRRDTLKRADEIVAEMVDVIVADFGDVSGRQALVFVNGFGGTPSLELYLVYNSARRLLEARGINIVRSLVGSYVTSLDMAGCSLTVSLLDPTMLGFWDAQVLTAGLRWGL